MHLFKKKLYLTPIRAKLNKVEDKQLFVRDEWNDSLMTAPEFQQLSAYSISRSWKTYQLRHIQVERRNHKAERMWFYVCLLRILDVNERNDKCQWCQRTSPYPINIESITYRGLDEVNVIRAYYLHLHDGAIRNLSKIKYRLRKRMLCSRERTTSAASICVVVNVATTKI